MVKPPEEWRAVQGPRGKPYAGERQPLMKVPAGTKSPFRF